MRVEGLLFAAGSVFFFIVAAVYWVLSREPAGTTALVLTGGLAFLIGFYVLYTGHRIGMRPEDRSDGDIEENAGVVGFYSPHSWWPLPTAAGAALVSLGLIFGRWLTLLGVLVLGLSIIGFVFEYYRGEHSH